MARALVLCLMGASSVSLAQETYTVPLTTAAQVAAFRDYVLERNEETCSNLGLAAGCTQAAACTAAKADGGTSCTPAQARAAEARIWPDSQAGREEFVRFAVVAKNLSAFINHVKQRYARKYCTWWRDTASRAQKDAHCAAAGLPAGCEVCE